MLDVKLVLTKLLHFVLIFFRQAVLENSLNCFTQFFIRIRQKVYDLLAEQAQEIVLYIKRKFKQRILESVIRLDA